MEAWETGWLYKCLSRWKTPMMSRLRRTPTRRTTSNEVVALLVRVKNLGVEIGGRAEAEANSASEKSRTPPPMSG